MPHLAHFFGAFLASFFMEVPFILEGFLGRDVRRGFRDLGYDFLDGLCDDFLRDRFLDDFLGHTGYFIYFLEKYLAPVIFLYRFDRTHLSPNHGSAIR